MSLLRKSLEIENVAGVNSISPQCKKSVLFCVHVVKIYQHDQNFENKKYICEKNLNCVEIWDLMEKFPEFLEIIKKTHYGLYLHLLEKKRYNI